jgi:hypothetical protein
MADATDTKDKIDEAEGQSSTELRESLMGLGAQLREMRLKPEDQRSENWAREIRDVGSLVVGLDAEHRIAELTEAADRKAALEGRKGAGSEANGTDVTRVESRSIGRQVVESEQFNSWQESRGGSGVSGDIEVRTLMTEGTYADANASAGLWAPRGTPFLPDFAIDRRRLFVRDMIASGSTELLAIPYIQENNPRAYEEGATAVAEGTAKPEVSMLFTQVIAPVRKIAAWVPVTTEVLEDATTLASYIDGRLGYMLAVREEVQTLNGTGVNADLLGITNAVGIQTQAAVGSSMADVPATIGAAIGLVEDVDGDADGVALNPLDFWQMVTTRHSSWLDGQAIGSTYASPYGEAPLTLWGLRAVRSRSVTKGKAVVGSWANGAQLFDRNKTVIRVGDQHSDYFTNNKVAILAEERVALAVYRPDWFVYCTL